MLETSKALSTPLPKVGGATPRLHSRVAWSKNLKDVTMDNQQKTFMPSA